MVNRIIKFLNKEFKGVNEAALLLGGFTLLSQILGLLRDRALAHFVGAGPVLDVYYAAFRIPDFLYISIASLASITVLMPFLMNRISKDGSKEKAKQFLNNIFSAYAVFMVLASIIIAILMPKIVHYIAPGFIEEQLSSLVTMSRIMLLSPIFIGLSNLIGTVTQLLKKFLVFSLSPVFYNVGIIFGIVFLFPVFGVYGLGLGVIIGAILHFLIQAVVVYKNGFFPKFILNINWQEIGQVVKLSAPRTLTLSCNSLAFLVLISIASTLKSGSISLFTFAYNLQSVPVGIIGTSYSVAAFPMLVKSFAEKNMKDFINQIATASRQIIFWSLPIISLLIVLRAQIVRVILGTGQFSWPDTRLTAASVALFIVSLVTQGLVLLLVRGYYAAGNTKKPFITNVSSSILVIVLAKLFIYLFNNYPNLISKVENLLRVKDVGGTVMLALPLAYALGSIINFIFLWIVFKKDFLKDKNIGILRTTSDSLLGALTMGSIAYVFLNIFDDVFNITTGWGIFMQGLTSGVIGILSGVLVLYLIKNKEFLSVIRALKNKFWRKKDVLAEEQEDLQ
jgi:putative peptidoglycan lipid II flippase